MMGNFDRAGEAVHCNGSVVSPILYDFNFWYGASLQKIDDRFPVVGWPVAQTQSYSFVCTCGRLAAQGAWGAVKQVLEGFIKSANAAETRGERYFSHGHSCFMNELLGEENSAG